MNQREIGLLPVLTLAYIGDAVYELRVRRHLLESGLVDYIISTSPHGRDPHRDSVKFRRKATELSIPCITALDTARILVNALRSDHDISGMELVDIATLHRDAANGK